MTLVVGPPLPVQRARGGAPQHSAPVPPLCVGHLPQRAVLGSQGESQSPMMRLSQVDAHLMPGTVSLNAIWIDAPGRTSHMARKKKQGPTHPYPNPSLHHQGG